MRTYLASAVLALGLTGCLSGSVGVIGLDQRGMDAELAIVGPGATTGACVMPRTIDLPTHAVLDERCPRRTH